MSFKNFPMVSKVVYGRGSFNQINEIIAPKRQNERAPFIYFIDDVFENNTMVDFVEKEYRIKTQHGKGDSSWYALFGHKCKDLH